MNHLNLNSNHLPKSTVLALVYKVPINFAKNSESLPICICTGTCILSRLADLKILLFVHHSMNGLFTRK